MITLTNNFLLTCLLVFLTFQLAAQPESREVVAPEISNPAIRKIVNVRSSRLSDIIDLKTNQYIGENNKGELQIINLKAVPKDQLDAVTSLIESENMDRKKMFMLIAQASSVGNGQLSAIRKKYAKAIREEAIKGEWIQMNNNLWDKKR
jgi:hypothetical protein